MVWAFSDPGFLCFTLCLLGGFPSFINEEELLIEGWDVCFSGWLMYLWGIANE